MKVNLFISYSHADEDLLNNLKSHLNILEREGLVENWYDRKILAGDQIDKEIHEHLEDSSVVLLLISSNFIASDYCYKKELAKAMEMHDQKTAIVIPVILRSCDWSRTPFGKLKAMPTDGQPVTKWEHEDDAWLEVVNGIRAALARHASKIIAPALTAEGVIRYLVSQNFSDWLEDTEILLTHRRVSKVLLSDIFVEPDLKAQFDTEHDILDITPALSLTERVSRCLIFGEEQQGKTTLLKMVFREEYKRGNYPVYLDGSKVNSSDVNKNIKRALSNQYSNFQDCEHNEIVILIDNVDQLSINDKAREKLLEQINKAYDSVIITSNKSFSYVASEVKELVSYSSYELMRFGHENRAELTEKWVAMGVEEQISDAELYGRSDTLKSQLDTIIRGNIVPPKPIYILLLLQMFEAASKANLDLTSYGHCYQELVYAAFKQAKVPNEQTGSYLNILTEFAWAQYKKENGGFLPNELNGFFDEYEKTYLKVDRLQVAKRLQSNAILTDRDGKLQFKYPYLYYFFVAKKIAEGYVKSPEIQEEVQTLLRDLHREDYANILVFVTHHTKDDWILDEIQLTLMQLFDSEEKAALSTAQLSFLDQFISDIPALVMEQREVSDERKKHHKNLDVIEDEKNNTEDGEIESSDLLAKINKTFKGMEIAGQIVRNRHASLQRETLYSIVEEGSATGLRFLNYFINLTDLSKEEVLNHIEVQLREHPNITDERVQKIAKDVYLHLTYRVINGIIRKIASSIGSKEAYEIYDTLEENEGTPSVLLLNEAISMHYSKTLNIEKIKAASQELRSNPVCFRILREMVIQHTYMFPVEYKVKQQLSKVLGISVKGQRLLDRRTEGKG